MEKMEKKQKSHIVLDKERCSIFYSKGEQTAIDKVVSTVIEVKDETGEKALETFKKVKKEVKA